MARSRNIKPGFFKNEELAELGAETMILFAGLWSVADKEGRLEDRPRRIRAECVPYFDFNVDEALTKLESAGFIQRYEISAVRYIQISNWHKHQSPHHRENDSEIPPPSAYEDLSLEEIRDRLPAIVPPAISDAVYARDGSRCVRCGSTESLSLDHILPQQRFGLHVPCNLRVLCRPCNSSRPVTVGLEDDLAQDGITIEVMQARCKAEGIAFLRQGFAQALPRQGCPSKTHLVPLIPDSLNLIPDSFNLDTGKQKRKSQRFTPPAIEDVTAYCIERANNIDPEAFIAYYRANGWKVGKSSMVDWKAAVITWEKNGHSNGHKPKRSAPPREGF